MQQTRQLGQQLNIARRFVFQAFDQAAPTHLVVHPAFQKRLGGGPQVQLWVQITAQAFDVEQGLLQQHQLRLYFHIESARCLEQTQQHLTQRDVFQRPVKVRLTNGADGAFQFVHAGVGGHPTRLDMQLGNALVVAPKKRNEVLRQVFLVEFSQRANDAKVQRDVAAKRQGVDADLDVAGVHVGMKKTVAKDLREKDGHAVARQLGNVHSSVPQRRSTADGHALHALHHDHGLGAQLPVHLGNHHQVQAGHVAAQLRSVGRFANQIKLVMQVVVELGNHFARLQALAIGRQLANPARHGAQQGQVVVDHAQNVGAQYLDGNVTAVF